MKLYKWGLKIMYYVNKIYPRNMLHKWGYQSIIYFSLLLMDMVRICFPLDFDVKAIKLNQQFMKYVSGVTET